MQFDAHSAALSLPSITAIPIPVGHHGDIVEDQGSTKVVIHFLGVSRRLGCGSAGLLEVQVGGTTTGQKASTTWSVLTWPLIRSTGS